MKKLTKLPHKYHSQKWTDVDILTSVDYILVTIPHEKQDKKRFYYFCALKTFALRLHHLPVQAVFRCPACFLSYVDGATTHPSLVTTRAGYRNHGKWTISVTHWGSLSGLTGWNGGSCTVVRSLAALDTGLL